MPVVVEITSGVRKGDRATIRPGQKLYFGRGKDNDFSFPGDDRMSRQHFVIEVGDGRCLVEDLATASGTFVDGRLIEERTRLDDESRIRAGNTHFLVRISQTIGFPAGNSSLPTNRIEQFSTENCRSGLVNFRATKPLPEGCPPGNVVGKIFKHCTPYLILDRAKLEPGSAPRTLPTAPLFDWLPPEAARAASPIIIPPGALQAELRAVVNQAWDRNALLCFFVAPNVSVEVVVRHFQAMSKWTGPGRPAPSGRGAGMLGWCWPSVLAPLLFAREAGFVERLLHGVTAVLMEVAGQPRQWQVFGAAEFGKVLEIEFLRV